jgi:hypothetical protein
LINMSLSGLRVFMSTVKPSFSSSCTSGCGLSAPRRLDNFLRIFVDNDFSSVAVLCRQMTSEPRNAVREQKKKSSQRNHDA